MASFQQLTYCRKCKKNVSLNEKGQCSHCLSTQIKKSWTVRFRFTEPTGNEVHKRLTGFVTKKEAQEGYIDFVNQARLQQPIVAEEKIKFDVLYEEYKRFTKTRIKESSYYDFCSKCDMHILPHFKDLNVQDITPKIILDWQNTKISQNSKGVAYSYKYKTCLRMYLSSILGYAEKYYGIDNKVKKVDNFRNVALKKEMLFWTPEEFNAFIEKVEKEEFKALFYALYYTGARKGEILATTWKDWDLKNNTLNIDKTVTKKVYGASYLITVPKNQTSIRQVTLPPILVDVMKEYKKGRENYNFVFYDDKPLADSSIGRVQDEACKQAEVKKIRLYDFRHSHASLLLSSGASVVAVAKRLGHSNIEQTLNTYAHMMPKEDDLLIKILQETTKKNAV